MEPVYLLCGLLLLFSGALSADVSGLGGACTPGNDTCTLNGAVCDTSSKTCVCNDGYVQSGTECARKHSMPCGNGMCIDWGNTMCDSNKCKCDSSKGLVANSGSCGCPTGQVMHSVEKKCMKIRGQPCTATADCYTTTGLICTSGTCTCDTAGKFVNGANTGSSACACMSGYTAVNGACVALVGKACGDGVTCQSGLVCDANVCKCDANQHYVAPGTANSHFSACVCETGYAKESGSDTCYKIQGQSCTADVQCISDMVCTNSKCACDTTKNYAAGSDNATVCNCPAKSTWDVSMNKCMKTVGETCTAGQCYSTLVCTGSPLTCDCDASKHLAAGTPGGTTCICASGYANKDGVCLKVTGQACNSASECYTGLVCTGSPTKCACDTSKNYGAGSDGQISCSCASGSIAKGGVCLKVIGQACNSASECYTGLVCTGSPAKCSCDTSKNYGPGTNGQTSCGCASGFMDKGGVCMKVIGTTCAASSECYTGLVCTGSPAKCACDTNKHYVAGIDGQVTCPACNTGYTLQSSVCRLNVGQNCTRGSDSTQCVYTATCSKETDKCTCDAAMGYTASGSTCVCKSGYTNEDGYCVAPLDGYCTSACVSGSQCFAGNSTYNHPICLCNGRANTDNTCSNAVGLVASLTSLMAALLVTWRLM